MNELNHTNSQPKDETWQVYMLLCADGTLYTGVTNDVTARLAQHNAGRGAKYTRARLPVQLVYLEPAGARGLALRREHSIKRMRREAKHELIEARVSCPASASASAST